MSRIDLKSAKKPRNNPIKEALLLVTAASAVVAMTQTVQSQRPPEARLQDEALSEDFAGDRRPGILHEPSEAPVGDQAALYLEQEWAFERARAAEEAESD